MKSTKAKLWIVLTVTVCAVCFVDWLSIAVRNQTLTEIQLLLQFWPHYAAGVILIVLCLLIKPKQ